MEESHKIAERILSYSSSLLLCSFFTISIFRHRVKFVDVTFFAGTAAGATECHFAKAAYLAHGVRRIVGIDDIDFVVAFVGVAQKPLLSKLGFYQVLWYRVNDALIHCVGR